MSTILAIDTALSQLSIVLTHKNQTFIRSFAGSKAQGQQLLPIIDELLAEQELTLKDLTAIAACPGPGRFTGIRMGLAVIQALTMVVELPIIPLSSLELYAWQAYKISGANKVLVVLDAKMQELYLGQYTCNEQGVAALIPMQLLKTELLEQLPKQYPDSLIVGDVLTDLDPKLQQIPPGAIIAELAAIKWQQQQIIKAEQLEAYYLRQQKAWAN